MEYDTKFAPHELGRDKTYKRQQINLPSKEDILEERLQRLDDESLMRALTTDIKGYYANTYINTELIYDEVEKTLYGISGKYVDKYLNDENEQSFLADVRGAIFEFERVNWAVGDIMGRFKRDLEGLPKVESENRQESLEEMILNVELKHLSLEQQLNIVDKAFNADNNIEFQKLCFDDMLEFSLENMMKNRGMYVDLTIDRELTAELVEAYKENLFNDEGIKNCTLEALMENGDKSRGIDR